VLKFDEATHTYTVDGTKFESVTTILKHAFPPFIADEVIQNVQKSPNSEYFMKSAAEIKAIWKQRADDGTKLHDDIEKFYNNIEIANESKEFEQFIQFFRETTPELKPFRTEWRIFCKDHLLAGTIDMLFVDKKGNFHIFDWKRCKKIDKNSFNNRKALWPIQHLPDSNYWKYSLQLNVYKYMLKKSYGIEIKSMALVQMHPDLDKYIIWEVPDMQYEVGEILKSLKNKNI
jgi:ATP-dependent exoDNAse (exonuclease V) beta subunit